MHGFGKRAHFDAHARSASRSAAGGKGEQQSRQTPPPPLPPLVTDKNGSVGEDDDCATSVIPPCFTFMQDAQFVGVEDLSEGTSIPLIEFLPQDVEGDDMSDVGEEEDEGERIRTTTKTETIITTRPRVSCR